MKNFYIILLTLFCLNKLSAQKSSGGVPAVLKNNFGINNIPVLTLQTLNNEAELQRADSISNAICNSCKNNYYGRGIDVSIDIKNDGQLTILNIDSSKLWTIAIESSTAYGMEFFFSNFNIPDGAELFFYNSDTSVIMGAYTSDNNPVNTNGNFQFATQYIKGNKVIIEYKEPNNADFEGELKISTIVHIFRNLFDKSGPFAWGSGAGSCNINVVCPLGSGWENETKSVGIILYYFSVDELRGFCTGAVINNTKQDGRPLFLTANHCVDNGSGGTEDYSTWLVLFNHQTTTCESDGSDVPSYTGQSVPISSILSRAATPSDYCLMELQTQVEILQQWGVCYAGWDKMEENGSSSPYTVGIHHPSGDIKKISKDFDTPCSSAYLQNCGNGDNHWRVVWNNSSTDNNGVTEGGSSGSPLFNSNHRIIGQLHGGYTGCPDSNPPGNPLDDDWYGKFSTSWAHSGANGFAFYLDPGNTGQTSVNTYCPSPGGSAGGGGGGAGTGYTCDHNKDMNEGMKINDNIDGIPCLDIPLILTPLNHPIYSSSAPNSADQNECEQSLSQWIITAAFRQQKCNSAPDEDLCKVTGIWDATHLKCECKYREYFIEITLVDDNYNTIGPTVSKWFSEQLDRKNIDTGELTWTRLESVTIDQNKLNELGISLESGKLYRIKLAANQGGWQEAVRYFRMELNDIYYTNTNLVSSSPSFTISNFPDFIDFATDNTFVFNSIGRNVTIDNVTTINYIAPVNNMTVTASNIDISATNSISISNAVITGNFVAAIVDDECAGFSGRMANPNDDKNTKPDKYYNERVVYYNSNPARNDTAFVSKNKEDENLALKASTEPAYLLIPNPSSSGRFIFSSQIPESGNCELVIFNLLGEKIFQSRIPNTQSAIDISNQPKGTYFVQISNGEEFSVQKIVYQ